MAAHVYEWTLDDDGIGNGPPKGWRMYLDDDYAIPPGWVRVDSALSIVSAPVPTAMPSDVPLGSVPKNYGASIEGKRLTKEGELMKSEWDHLYKAQGCTCDAGQGVCGHCSHPGHPYSLENNSRYWEDIPAPTRADRIMEAIRQIAGKS